ncbi:HAD-IIIC family phosphatase [Paenibacillus polysaccharolyticus]|uniref:HAD-IIIC family phosphatase n=1 Tax=Paenibacillus polysaccharolyticus TaxID=582692 RepID=UPI00209E384E|nr:HAD-IIIC family phosphatase [Paenibacillus polysaccharolyticus]MCP1132756.1 HAD-IIIC family phosphatase [Paenibacillus polysaccharolyticus]
MLNNLSDDIKRIVITSTFETDPIVSYISWWAERMLPFKLEVTLHKGRMLKDLLFPRSQFMNSFDYRVVFNRFEDWIRDDDHLLEPHKYEKLEFALSEMLNTIETASKREALMVAIFPISTEAGLSNTLLSYLQELNQRWKEALQQIPTVHIIDFESAQNLYGIERTFDYVKENLAHMPFSQEFDAVMGAYLVRQVHALINQTFKVIVLDCDNTLWEGICGEDQASVVIDKPFQILQQIMQEKMGEGFLLSIVSKNNESDVWNVFETYKDMVLNKEDFVSWRINWKSKAENIREIAQELNLGLDSFIFLDDSPHECLEVMNQLPEVLTLKIPKDKKHIPSFLSHIWALDKALITDEDRKRTFMQKTTTIRKTLEAKSPEEYLKELQLRVFIDKATVNMLPRLSQLTQRTNQFNSSIIRRTENELNEILKSENYVCWAIEVVDRFGSYGLTGLIINQILNKTLVVDTFLLSCRVLGRGVEASVFSTLKSFCEMQGLSEIKVIIHNGEKNTAIKEFLRENKWIENNTEVMDQSLFSISIANIPSEVAHIDLFYGQGLTGEAIETTDSTRSKKQILLEDNGGWETFVENEQKLIHVAHFTPLQHSRPEELKLLPLGSNVTLTLIDKELSSIENLVNEGIRTVWGKQVTSLNEDTFDWSTEPIWLKYAFVSEIFEKVDMIIPTEELDQFTTRTSIVNYLEELLKGMDKTYV